MIQDKTVPIVSSLKSVGDVSSYGNVAWLVLLLGCVGHCATVSRLPVL